MKISDLISKLNNLANASGAYDVSLEFGEIKDVIVETDTEPPTLIITLKEEV